MAISRIEKSVSRVANDEVYGHGGDGDVVITSNTTITSDAFYNNLTVNAGVMLHTNGYRVFVKNTLTLNGNIGIGALSGGVIIEATSTVPDGTVKGHSSGVITYRAGGQGGGGTNPNITALPSFLYKDINAMSGGAFMHTSGMIAIGGGSRGTTGTAGADGVDGVNAILTNSDTWPGKAGSLGTLGAATGSTGAANPYRESIGVPGGRGNTGADGNVTGMTAGLGGVKGLGGAGGSGGLGGGVVCVIAKYIVGTGKIVSIGSSGAAGSSGTSGTSGTTGTAGTAGTPGTKAPDLNYHVAPVANHVAPTHNPSHHHGGAIFSDFHAHGVNPHPHCCASHTAASHYAGDSKNPPSHSPASHYGGHNHNSNHYHHTGGRHHPHSNDGHGGMHYYAHSGYSGTHYKANHAYQHSHPATTGTFHGRIEHLHAGGTDGHTHAGHGHPGHTHTHANGNDLGNGVDQGGGMQVSGGHHHGPHTYSNGVMDLNRWSHHANPNTHTAQPDGHWVGGAGGAGGAAAPAQTGTNGTPGQAGKRGGAGGGGAILVVCDSVAETVTYDNRAGLLDSGDSYSATNGSSYILINQ